MQGINRVDSWAQFVGLVQEARTRNQAVSAAGGAAKTVRRTIGQAVAAPQSAATARTTAAFQTAPETAKVRTKALGSIFDAYA